MKALSRFSARFRGILHLIVLILTAGCGGSSQIGLQSTGRANTYEPGFPNFDMEAIALWKGNQPGIDVHVSIPYRSLSFVRAPDGFVAAFTTSLQAKTAEDDKMVQEKEWVDTIRVRTYESTQRFDGFTFTRTLRIDPGMYHIDVMIHDHTTNKVRLRSQGVRVFSLEPGQLQLSPLWVEAQTDSQGSKPIVALHLPSNIGALKSVSVLYNAQQFHEVAAQIVVMKFATDTSIATPPYSFPPSQGSLTFAGLDYSRRDTVHVEKENFESPRQEMPIEFRLPKLSRGVYLLEEKVFAGPTTGMLDSIVLRARYELAVNESNFPRPSTLEELIEALPYLAKEDELKVIASAPTVQEKRKQFELFWLRLGKSEQGASNLIRQYYTRVEEANLFFTSYKEGWKTDRGMIYIIMGPPISISSRLSQEYWYYSYDEQDMLSTFLFERSRNTNPPGLFQAYVLLRQPYYSSMWDRVIERWRSGIIQ